MNVSLQAVLNISTEHEYLSHFLSRATGALHERDKKNVERVSPSSRSCWYANSLRGTDGLSITCATINTHVYTI
jgi:hypothetical protein